MLLLHEICKNSYLNNQKSKIERLIDTPEILQMIQIDK